MLLGRGQLLAIGGLILSLVGCAAIALQRQQAAWAEANRIALECREKRLSGELPGHAASARCSTDRMRQVIAESGYPYMDLVDLYLAYRLAASQRIDEGTLSEEDAQLRLAELNARINSEVQQRNVMAEQAYSQRLQSMGCTFKGSGCGANQ